jgi:hypothetical protein
MAVAKKVTVPDVIHVGRANDLLTVPANSGGRRWT